MEGEIGRFYPTQKVVAVDAMQNSTIKNGQIYTVSSYHYSQSSNPLAKGKFFWYIGIVGIHEWLRPSIFAPLEDMPPIAEELSFYLEYVN